MSVQGPSNIPEQYDPHSWRLPQAGLRSAAGLGLLWLILQQAACGPARPVHLHASTLQTAGERQQTVSVAQRFRMRSPPGYRWSEGLATRLSPHLLVIMVRSDADWAAIWGMWGWTAPASPDWSAGMIVGVCFEPGEPVARSEWPIQLVRVVRVEPSGLARIELQQTINDFYPLVACGYLELAYVPGVSGVSQVIVDDQSFGLLDARPADATDSPENP